jgi:hypothetical protein
MFRTITWVGAVGLGVMFAGACGDDADVIDGRSLGGRGGSAGGLGVGGARPGAGGTATGMGGSAGANAAGAAGVAGTTGSDGDAGLDASAGSGGGSDGGAVVVAPLDAGDAGPIIPCATLGDCEDNNVCTTQACVASFCQFTPVAPGSVCGDQNTSECTQPDTCSADGTCLANNDPDGAACADGHCNLAGVCDCAIERITAVPYGELWQTSSPNDVSVFDGSCQDECAGDLEHIVVFQAPAAGTYLFSTSSIGDAQIAILAGDCTTLGAELGCDTGPQADADAQVTLDLELGEVVTVGVSEICEPLLGGEGSISITLVP